MNKILLTSLFVVAGVLVPSQDAMGMAEITGMTIADGGKSEWSKIEAGYKVTGEVDVSGELDATNPVQISNNGKLKINTGSKCTFGKNLSIYNGGTLQFNSGGVVGFSAELNVAGTLTLKGVPVFINTPEINMSNIQGETKSNIDVSDLAGTVEGFVLNGQGKGDTKTFLKYYNTVDTGNTDCIANLSESTYDSNRNSYAEAIRDRLTNLFDYEKENAGYLQNVTLNNVYIQDYIVEPSHYGLQNQNNNISFKIIRQTILNEELRTLATGNGLTVVNDSNDTSEEPDLTDFDFYTEFSTYNKSENSFVEWPPLSDGESLKLSSSSTDEHTQFEFKTNLAPSTTCTHDLSVTNGPKSFSTLVLSADNTGFAGHKIKLNGDLNTVVYGSATSYAVIDFSNNSGTDLNLTFNGNSSVTSPCVVKDSGQKINLNVSANAQISFNAVTDSTNTAQQTVYSFDALTMDSTSKITVTNKVTLVI